MARKKLDEVDTDGRIVDVGLYAYSLVNQRFCMEQSTTSVDKECLGKGKTCFEILAF